MKIINKMIRRTILEIALVIAFVIISIPIWQSFDLSDVESVAYYYDNIEFTTLEVSDYSDYILYQASDEIAIQNIKPINIKLNNDTNTKEEYNLYIVVDKTSTLDTDLIKINYNGETKLLSELKQLEDESYAYFLLESGTLVSREYESNLLMWIDIEQDDEITDKYLIFDIENIIRQVL